MTVEYPAVVCWMQKSDEFIHVKFRFHIPVSMRYLSPQRAFLFGTINFHCGRTSPFYFMLLCIYLQMR